MVDATDRRRIYISVDLGKTFTVKTLDFTPTTFNYCPYSQDDNYVASYDHSTQKVSLHIEFILEISKMIH